MKEQLVPELRFPEFEGEWEIEVLENILEFKNGLNKAKEYFGYGTPIVNYMDVNKNKHLLSKNIEGKVDVLEKEIKRYKVIKGDVFFTRTSETIEEIGLASVIIDDIKDCVYSGFVLRGRNKTNKVDSIFAAYLYNSGNVRKDIMRKSSKTTRALTNGKLLGEVVITLPSFQEQQKIGDFFYKIDKKLELQQEKIENLKKYKKGMMQRIFSQEIRFKDDNGNNYPDWEEKKLEEISKESIIKYKDYNKFDELLSVTLHDGIKKQSELGERDISSENKSNYKVVRKNNLVYNSMRMWQGASGISKYNGIVSSAYVVINMLGNINPEFIGYYFKQSEVIHKFYKKSQGMTSDTLTLKYNLFKDVIISIPIKEEQTKIVNFLSSIDKKIELEEEKLEEYKNLKKGLMQRMFI